MKVFKSLSKQLSALTVSLVAVACCLGVPFVLAAVSAVGLSFLIRDDYLLFIFMISVILFLKFLYSSTCQRKSLFPFWTGVVGGVISCLGFWFFISGIYSLAWPIYLGLGLLVIASIWDFINGIFAFQKK